MTETPADPSDDRRGRRPAAGSSAADEPGAREVPYFHGGPGGIASRVRLRPRRRRQEAPHRRDRPHYAGEEVRTLYTDPRRPARSTWADADEAGRVIDALDERGIDLHGARGRGRAAGRRPVRPALPPRVQRPAAAPAGSGPRSSATAKPDFFDQYGPEARAVLEALLDKYAEHGVGEFVLPDVWRCRRLRLRHAHRDRRPVRRRREAAATPSTELQEYLYAA